MRRTRQIPFALSQETLPHFRTALDKLADGRTAANRTVKDVKEGDDGQGNPIGIIEVEEDV